MGTSFRVSGRSASQTMYRNVALRAFEGAAVMGLEGIMAKRSDSPYRSGRSGDWLKMRVEHTGTFAVVGFTKPEGTRAHFGALHVAGLAHGALVYAGRVGTGFDTKQIKGIHADLVAISGHAPPVTGLPEDEAVDMGDSRALR